MSEPQNPTFAAIPMRAIGNPALSGADLRALCAVAAHDRFARNKTGCFASYKRLASITGLAIETVKRSVAKLVDQGYLRSEANPMDARRRILFVEYNEADADAMQGDARSFVKPARLQRAPAPSIGDELVPENIGETWPVENCKHAEVGDEIVTDRRGVGDQSVTDWDEIGDRRKCQPFDSVERSETNIFCEAVPKRSCETEKRFSKAEATTGNSDTAPPWVIADGERVVRGVISGKVDVGYGVDRMRRVIGRLRSYGDVAGERRAVAMVEAMIADAPRPGPIVPSSDTGAAGMAPEQDGVVLSRERQRRIGKAAETLGMSAYHFANAAGGLAAADFLARRFEDAGLSPAQLRAALGERESGIGTGSSPAPAAIVINGHRVAALVIGGNRFEMPSEIPRKAAG